MNTATAILLTTKGITPRYMVKRSTSLATPLSRKTPIPYGGVITPRLVSSTSWEWSIKYIAQDDIREDVTYPEKTDTHPHDM